jgi:Flp pilus assembly protein TadG
MQGLRAKLKSRRGFTLVLMMLMMTVFIGAAAFAIDIGHMYLLRSDLHASSDASALAGISKYAASNDTNAARVEAQNFAARFTADHSALSLAGADFVFGHWDPPSGSLASFIAGGTPLNAVKVTVRYTGNFFAFGRFLGFNTHQVTATSIAVHGSTGSTTCLRPFGVPYQQLLDVLYPPAGTKAPTYNLTLTDVTNLSQLTAANQISLKVGTSGGYAPNGQFYAVQTPPGEYANGTKGNPISGANPYSNGISGCSGNKVSLGDWLQPETGNMAGPTEQGVGGQGGGQNAILGLCGTSDTCDPPVKVVVALWDQLGDAPNNNCNACYHVKYLGVFELTGYDKANKAVTGFFQTLTQSTGGGFSGNPGPVMKNGLVY